MPTEKEVKDMFKEEVETFIAVFPRVKGVKFVVEAKHYRDSPRKRDIAWYDTNASSSGISIVTSGGNITITVAASGWFTI